MYDVERIKNDSDLITIAEMAGAKFHRVSGGWRSHCPIHGGDNSSAFAVYDDDKKWCCFTHDCGQGDVIEFVQKWRGIDFQAACEWLGGEQNITQAEMQEQRIKRLERRVEKLEEEAERQRLLLEEMERSKNWLKYNETLENNQQYQTIWEAQGIPPSWQSFWQLGYCEKFTAKTNGQLFTSPSLTIPIFEHGEIRNIRHRLLNPLDPHDKYRPERPGLGAIPFYADSSAMYDKEYILYVEGEKKAMVTFLTLDSPKWQVIGIPGKHQWKREIERLNGQKVITLFDPDALENSIEFARAAGGHYVDLPVKIDDLINEIGLNKTHLRQYLRTARAA